MGYVVLLEVVVDDLARGGPVVVDEEGDVEGAFRCDGGSLLDGDAFVGGALPSALVIMYSLAPSTVDMSLSTSSTLISWFICVVMFATSAISNYNLTLKLHNIKIDLS